MATKAASLRKLFFMFAIVAGGGNLRKRKAEKMR
jgi:hypothetical protein